MQKNRLHGLFISTGFVWATLSCGQSPIQNWEGNWQGTMRIGMAGKPEEQAIEVPVEMQIAKTDTPGVWLWLTKYKGSMPVEKKYYLKAKDESKGAYETDEGNGIVLPMTLIGKSIYSRFEVMNNLLSTCYTLDGDTLYFEVIRGSTKPGSTSGKGNEESPEVLAFPIQQVQRSVLSRLR
jgi:hypothetical protein